VQPTDDEREARGARGDVAPEKVHCPHADRCSGCPLIELDYDAQLEHKRARLASAHAAYVELRELPVARVVGTSARTHYRTRAKLMVAPGPRVGLFAKGTEHEVVDLPDCRVLSPLLLEVSAKIRALAAAPAPAAGRALSPEGTGALAAIDLREVVGREGSRVLVTLVLADLPSPPELDAAAAAIILQDYLDRDGRVS